MLDDNTLDSFEKAVLWKISSSSRTVSERPGWTLAVSRVARGSGCCVCMAPEVKPGEFSILDRIFLRDPSEIHGNHRPAIMLPKNLVSEFGYVEATSSLPAWARRKVFEAIWERGFAAVFSDGYFFQNRRSFAFDDGIEVRCESGEKLFLEWDLAGCPEPGPARKSENSGQARRLGPPLAEAEQKRWDFGAALTWEANRIFGASGNRRFRLAVAEGEMPDTPETIGLSFVLEGGSEQLDVAEIWEDPWKSQLEVSPGSLEPVKQLEKHAKSGAVWMSDIPDISSIVDILTHLRTKTFTATPPRSRPDMKPVVFDSSRKAAMVERWEEAGKPKVWLEDDPA